jgi:flavin reductase (DIM6/NTAB) family NADH-FMN oxidoreductase RutF
MVKEVEFLGSTSGSEHMDKLAAAGLRYRKDEESGVPLLEDAVAYLVCKVSESVSVGDHELLVADVLRAVANDDFQEYWKFAKYHPILYAGMPDHLRTYSA